MSLKSSFKLQADFFLGLLNSKLTNYCFIIQVKLVKITYEQLNMLKFLFFVYNSIPNTMPMHKIGQIIIDYSVKTSKSLTINNLKSDFLMFKVLEIVL